MFKLLQVIQDVCEQAAMAAEKPYLGSSMLASLLQMCRDNSIAMARQSASTMLSLVFKCPENAAYLMQSAEMSNSLCAELCHTGDFQIQMDLAEIVFRAAKHGLLTDQLVQHFGDEVILKLGKLTSMPVKSINLATELRCLVMALNHHLGDKARVHSVLAKACSLGQMNLAGQWIDFGTVSFLMGLPDEVGNGSCPEALDINADSCKGEVVMPSGNGSETILRLLLPQFPAELMPAKQQIFQKARRRAFKIELTFHSKDFQHIAALVPQVSTWAQKKCIQASKDLLGSEETFPAASLRPTLKPKCSVGIYPALNLIPAPVSLSGQQHFGVERFCQAAQPASSAVPSAGKQYTSRKLDEVRDMPPWMQNALGQDIVGPESGCLLPNCSHSPSRASTNASEASQNSMEHAQKITPEHKPGGKSASAHDEAAQKAKQALRKLSWLDGQEAQVEAPSPEMPPRSSPDPNMNPALADNGLNSPSTSPAKKITAKTAGRVGRKQVAQVKAANKVKPARKPRKTTQMKLAQQKEQTEDPGHGAAFHQPLRKAQTAKRTTKKPCSQIDAIPELESVTTKRKPSMQKPHRTDSLEGQEHLGAEQGLGVSPTIESSQQNSMPDVPLTGAPSHRLRGFEVPQHMDDALDFHLRTTERRPEPAPSSRLRSDTDDEEGDRQDNPASVEKMLASMLEKQDTLQMPAQQTMALPIQPAPRDMADNPMHPLALQRKLKIGINCKLPQQARDTPGGLTNKFLLADKDDDRDLLAPFSLDLTSFGCVDGEAKSKAQGPELPALPRPLLQQASCRREHVKQLAAANAPVCETGVKSERVMDTDGPSLQHVVASMLQEAPDDSEEEESSGGGLAELQQTMARVVANQKQAARKKQMDILQTAQAQIDEENARFAKSIEHDMACLQAASQAQLQKLSQQMAGKMASIKQLQEQCQQETLKLWQQCQDIYTHSKPVFIQIQAAAEKQQAQKKRKFADLQARSAAVMQRAEDEIAHSSRKAQKLPSIAKLLKTFV
ncbi:hypothetical protein WJX74_010158 [Apatococcus lobatus]|uniref:Uncharacterized protein n=1 Tax=Apatococcus lobatus TaxID=904363 RepID=A0AAW1S5X8_9CHLO